MIGRQDSKIGEKWAILFYMQPEKYFTTVVDSYGVRGTHFCVITKNLNFFQRICPQIDEQLEFIPLQLLTILWTDSMD